MTTTEEMTYDLVKKIDKRTEDMQKDIGDIKVENEKTNGKIHVLDFRLNRLDSDHGSLRTEFENHEDDSDVHYNGAYANETPFQKARRNAVPYTIAGGSVTTLMIAIVKLIEWWLANNG